MTNTGTFAGPDLPLYGSKPTQPGMYLGLFHGRDEPKEAMEDWGFNGPTIGPLQWVHTTYTCIICIAFHSDADAMRYFSTRDKEHFLELHGDMVAFGGKFYGDWTVYTVGPDECGPIADSFRSSKRAWDHCAHNWHLS